MFQPPFFSHVFSTFVGEFYMVRPCKIFWGGSHHCLKQHRIPGCFSMPSREGFHKDLLESIEERLAPAWIPKSWMVYDGFMDPDLNWMI